MAGIDATDLNLLADELLVASVEALDTIPVFDPALEGAPLRAFVSPGQPAFDCCDQLAVYANLVQEAPTLPGGLGAGNRNRTGRINHVTYLISITRCLPSSDPDTGVPPAGPLALAAAQTNADAWALWNHLWNMWRSGALLTICDEAFFDRLVPIPPAGGCAGWLLSLRVRLDGYEEP